MNGRIPIISWFSDFFGDAAKVTAIHGLITKGFDALKKSEGDDFSSSFLGVWTQRFRAVYQRTVDDYVHFCVDDCHQDPQRVEAQKAALTSFLSRCKGWERDLYMLAVSMPDAVNTQRAVLGPMFEAPNDPLKLQILRQTVGDNPSFQQWLETEIRDKFPKIYKAIAKDYGDFKNFCFKTIPRTIKDTVLEIDNQLETKVVPALEPLVLKACNNMKRIESYFDDRR